MSRKRPSWCPEDAEDWGFKVLTLNRESGCDPSYRSYGCLDSKCYTVGRRFSYPENQTIFEPSFCTCDGSCCKGLHYFRELNAAIAFREELHSNRFINLIVVRCFVPQKARFKVSKINQRHKGRADMLVTLQRVTSKGKLWKE